MDFGKMFCVQYNFAFDQSQIGYKIVGCKILTPSVVTHVYSTYTRITTFLLNFAGQFDNNDLALTENTI